ncbi:MAG TPA: PQQ-dependent sugar dehydrogenase [Chloroflexota bacterium]|nr:PQQ-dependent sugar dehydrogenase [Chloroflexota bacterium]
MDRCSLGHAAARHRVLASGAALLLALAAGRAVSAVPAPVSPAQQQLANIQLPPGFRINLFAEGLGYARFATVSPQGYLVVTSSSRAVAGQGCSGADCVPNDGRVFILPDRDGDGVADEVIVFADGLDRPQGLAYYRGDLYVGEYGRVVRLPDRDGDLRADAVEVVVDHLPTKATSPTGHWQRNIAFGPDDKLYVGVGSSCNVCIEEDPRNATILQYNADGSGERIFARGIRNPVGITIHPATGELWATNNGRDLLGDDFPPEFVTVVRDGDHFGWPFCHVGVPDPDFAYLGDCTQTRAPTAFLPAHSAPLGLTFYTGQQFPAEYRGDLFVALHGSWNRSRPQGYSLVRFPMRDGVPGPMETFASGWLTPETPCANNPADLGNNVPVCRADVWGRPVAPVVGADGALYLTDDRLGAVYRISYVGAP